VQANRAAIGHVRAWQPNSQGRGILLTGPTGLGKSRAFWSLLHRLMVHEGHEVEIWSAADLFRELQIQVNYGRDDSARWLRRRAEAPILAIDDLGQQAILSARADWAGAAFFDLIDKRMGHRRPMIITTNLTARDIAGGHGLRGDPLLRRLLDACEVVKFNSPIPAHA
jgi:DNA replication protein DnaC